ncbi:MAG: class I SAM-dependent methyltransferase [Hyphomicrobiaceae bacterium]|nr:class I SAM-dependent methyltransferase [Hyphomicrobiaceae bacterium]
MAGSMHLYVTELRDFYETPLGIVARRLIRRQIRKLWPEVHGQQMVGLGYAPPYLLTYHQRTPVAALMPAHQGVTLWPHEGPYKAALVDELNLPLADSSVERVLAVHALEMSEHGEDMLQEAWRILKPEGELLLIVPNRRGPWANRENTPFGHGRPYSRTQLEKLLFETGFIPEKWHPALFIPPSHRSLMVRFAIPFERFGARAWPAFAGVHIVLARKQVYRGLLKKQQANFPARLVPVPSAICITERTP